MKPYLRTLRSVLMVLLVAPLGHAWGQTSAQQDAFDGGLAAFDRGAYDAALTAWRPLADGGLAAAQLGLGVLFFDGLGVDQDDDLAARWFARAAEAGNVEAQFNLGRMYFSGRGLGQNIEQARQWYERASDGGHAEASYNLGTLYASGALERNPLLAFHRFDLAVAQAEPGRVRVLAERNRGLMERRLDADQVAQARTMTAEVLRGQGDAVASGPAAGSYAEGLAAFNEKDYETALAAWRPAALGGDANAQLGLAVAYHDGLGVTQDLSAAASWFRRAAEQGLAEAQFNLGVLFYSGRGLAVDPVEAARWYVLAGDQGHAEANYYLGTMYVAGLGVARDNLAAYRRFELAVEQSGGGGEVALNRLAVRGREAVTRRLTPDEIAVLEGRPAPVAEVGLERPAEALAEAPVEVAAVETPVREPADIRARVAESGGPNVGELEAAAGQAREAQGVVDTMTARLAELDKSAAQNNAAAVEAELASAAQQLTRIDDQLAVERATLTENRKALVRAEKGARTAQRNLSSLRRAQAGAQTQMDAIAEELAEIEERRQVVLRRQAASQEQFDKVNDEVEEKTTALDVLGQQGEQAKKGLEGSGERLAALDKKRVAAVASQAAAEARLRAVAEGKKQTAEDLADARKALSEATVSAAAARERLAAATLAFNQADSVAAAAEPVIAAVPPGQPAQPAKVPEERVARVQRSLASLGYDPGRVDGMAGERTLDALRQFQTDNGLPATGKVTEEMAFSLAILASARGAPVQRKLVLTGTGTGFVVTGDGQVLTNDHVVKGCVEVRVKYSGEIYVAPHLASDVDNDLALLNTAIQTEDFLAFRAGRAIRPGDDVVALGFPLQGQLSDQVKVTRGTISALAGPGNDRTLLQTTTPVQAGSSGGPLLDLSGNIVGVVVGKISSVEVENVSFGIKAAIARIFLDAEGVNYSAQPSGEVQAAADVAARARKFIVLVECWSE